MISTVTWYGWLFVVIVLLAVLAIVATIVQRQRRAGGVLSVRPRHGQRRR
jgi:hypothetical protein